MKVLKPIQISAENWYAFTDSQFDDYPEWSSATAYVVGDKVIVSASKSQYQCLAANTNFSPLTNPAKWVKIGSSKAWRPFDGYLSTVQTTSVVTTFFDATGLGLWNYPTYIFQSPRVVVYPLTGLGAFDTVAVLGTDCSQVRVFFTNQAGVSTPISTIRSLDDSQIIDAWDYCFGDLTYRRDFVFEGIDGWGTGNLSQLYIEISHDFTPIEAPISVGEIIVGLSHEIGVCHADAQIQLVDYSKKEIDAYGTVTIVQRAYSLNGAFDVEIDAVDRNRVQSLITSLRATPCVYYPTAGDANSGVVIYGYVKDYNTTYQTPYRAYASLEIEGMI